MIILSLFLGLDLSKFCSNVEPSNGCPVLKTKVGQTPVPAPVSSLHLLEKIVDEEEEPEVGAFFTMIYVE